VAWLLFPTITVGFVGLIEKKKENGTRVLTLCIMLVICVIQGGCIFHKTRTGGGGDGTGGTPSGTYVVTVIGTADSVQHSTKFNLTVR
jgi:hypothetical protein